MFICPIWFKSSKLHKFHIYALKMWFWCQMQNKKGSLHLCSCNLLSHRHACLQSELHQEPRLPSMAVRRKTPLLHFYSPILDSVPEKARNVRAAQFKPGTCRKSLSILLHSSLFLLFQFFLVKCWESTCELTVNKQRKWVKSTGKRSPHLQTH